MLKGFPTFKKVSLNTLTTLLSPITIVKNEEVETSSNYERYSKEHTLPTNYPITAPTQPVDRVHPDAFDLIISHQEVRIKIWNLLFDAKNDIKKLAVIKAWIEFGCLSYKEALVCSQDCSE